MFKKAERKKAKLRLALCAPSGGGKTYSALRIAQGLGGKIAFIDTERGSGELYANLCEYDVCQIEPPFHPEKYVNAIHAAERAGYSVIIIDSLSHAWAGTGGLLEEVDKRKGKGNDFTAWREITPMHNLLVDAMLQSNCHIIGTMRTKTAYDMAKDERTGKIKPVKVGLAPVQRDGLEYEFTVVLDIDLDKHTATASKDRTGLFDGKYFTPTIETGAELLTWLEDGKEAFNLDRILFSVQTANTVDRLKEMYLTHKDEAEANGMAQKFNQAVTARKAELEAMSKAADKVEPMTDAQRKRIMVHYKDHSPESRKADMSQFLGREVASFTTLTKEEASAFIEAIEGDVAA